MSGAHHSRRPGLPKLVRGFAQVPTLGWRRSFVALHRDMAWSPVELAIEAAPNRDMRHDEQDHERQRDQ
jgi:hypothetical protein